MYRILQVFGIFAILAILVRAYVVFDEYVSYQDVANGAYVPLTWIAWFFIGSEPIYIDLENASGELAVGFLTCGAFLGVGSAVVILHLYAYVYKLSNRETQTDIDDVQSGEALKPRDDGNWKRWVLAVVTVLILYRPSSLILGKISFDDFVAGFVDTWANLLWFFIPIHANEITMNPPAGYSVGLVLACISLMVVIALAAKPVSNFVASAFKKDGSHA